VLLICIDCGATQPGVVERASASNPRRNPIGPPYASAREAPRRSRASPHPR
jgi:hypothetical protein